MVRNQKNTASVLFTQLYACALGELPSVAREKIRSAPKATGALHINKHSQSLKQNENQQQSATLGGFITQVALIRQYFVDESCRGCCCADGQRA
jgi:hypothetical protein